MDKIKQLADIEDKIAKNKSRRNYLQFVKLPELQGEIAMKEREYVDLYIARENLKAQEAER